MTMAQQLTRIWRALAPGSLYCGRNNPSTISAQVTEPWTGSGGLIGDTKREQPGVSPLQAGSSPRQTQEAIRAQFHPGVKAAPRKPILSTNCCFVAIHSTMIAQDGMHGAPQARQLSAEMSPLGQSCFLFIGWKSSAHFTPLLNPRALFPSWPFFLKLLQLLPQAAVLGPLSLYAVSGQSEPQA